jgi:hypothetical protein
MKIIITESQFYDLIPMTLKRRLSQDDFEILDKIIKLNMNEFIYLNDVFEEYLRWTLGDSLNHFVTEYKSDDIDMDEEDWMDKLNERLGLFWDLIYFLRKKYYEEFRETYDNYWRFKTPPNS